MSQRRVEALPPPPIYQRLTFRRGMIRTARFGPDFRTVLYGALWDDDVCRIYTVRPESPDSSALPLPPATPLAVSAFGELALSLGTHYRGIMTYGTLARVSLAGDAPRELQENVKYADWSPDGSDLVLVRGVETRDRLELLGGTLLAEPATPGGGVQRGFDGRSTHVLVRLMRKPLHPSTCGRCGAERHWRPRHCRRARECSSSPL